MSNIETHCHSHHSFDCNTSIENIIATCKKRHIEGIVVCDHDVCNITLEEEKLFAECGIKLFKAIEFTTKTDAHIIGVSPRIKELQQERFYYELDELIDRLESIKAAIIIPHPNHGTGIVGNGKIAKEAIEKAFEAAHFVERENYRYGKTQMDIGRDYPQIRYVIGSDAHSSNSVGAFVNQVEVVVGDFLTSMNSSVIKCHKNLEHSRSYWIMRAVKRSAPYQLLLRMFPVDLRRNIKNKLINR